MQCFPADSRLNTAGSDPTRRVLERVLVNTNGCAHVGMFTGFLLCAARDRSAGVPKIITISKTSADPECEQLNFLGKVEPPRDPCSVFRWNRTSGVCGAGARCCQEALAVTNPVVRQVFTVLWRCVLYILLQGLPSGFCVLVCLPGHHALQRLVRYFTRVEHFSIGRLGWRVWMIL